MGVLMAYVFETESLVYSDLRASIWLLLLLRRHGRASRESLDLELVLPLLPLATVDGIGSRKKPSYLCT